MPVFTDNTHAYGNTPLVRLNHVTADCAATVLAKIEGRNPAYSVKCRIGAHMIHDAEERGVLRPGMTVLEPTSGNTGIGLAYVCAARGYACTLVMPDTMSIERRQMMAVFGAQLVLTPGAEGMPGAIRKAEELAANDAQVFMPQQFRNPANPAVHELSTGPEIWRDTEGAIDVLVAGVGTGGTITGVARFIKQHKAIEAIAVEPAESPVISQRLAGAELVPGKHKIQGIGAGFIPETLDLAQVDQALSVSSEQAMVMARRVAREEGIVCGISCGAAVHVALELARDPARAGQTIVVVLPDSGERYLSTALFADLLAQ